MAKPWVLESTPRVRTTCLASSIAAFSSMVRALVDSEVSVFDMDVPRLGKRPSSDCSFLPAACMVRISPSVTNHYLGVPAVNDRSSYHCLNSVQLWPPAWQGKTKDGISSCQKKAKTQRAVMCFASRSTSGAVVVLLVLAQQHKFQRAQSETTINIQILQRQLQAT